MEETFIRITTLVALVINTIALAIVVYQTWLAKESLLATKSSIDEAKIERQLEALSRSTWIIHVRVQLERWQGDLKEKQKKLQLSIDTRDDALLKDLSENSIRSAKDLTLDRNLYEKMPHWLREIWMSGAQYYYNALASFPHLWKEAHGGQYDLAENLLEVCTESEGAITILLGYINEMVPPVILETPASLSNEDFFRN